MRDSSGLYRRLSLLAALLSVGHALSVEAVGYQATLVLTGQEGRRGLAVEGAGLASIEQPTPIEVEIYRGPENINQSRTAYQTVRIGNGETIGEGEIAGPGNTKLRFRDLWQMRDNILELKRHVSVIGSTDGGFSTAVSFSHRGTQPRSAVEYFAPGMIYGGTAHLPRYAIGVQPEEPIHIREDRMPAPLFGVRFPDSTALTVLDAQPDGGTTVADSGSLSDPALIDARLQMGAIGVEFDRGHLRQGFWFPGPAFDHGWLRHYHPFRDGLEQNYRLQFRFSQEPSFAAYLRQAWRWAFQTLKPAVTWNDLAALRASITEVLASQVVSVENRTGIPNSLPAELKSSGRADRKAILGFTGKNLESAELLLASGHRDQGMAIFKSFLRLHVSPPAAEGFQLDTGDAELALPSSNCIYLRSFSDDMKATLRAYRRELVQDRTHPNWLHWAEHFGDWLLRQQRKDGRFPRSWQPGIGKVCDASPQSSYHPIPFLVLLSEATHNPKYAVAAARAGEFAWRHGQGEAQFVGGTIDNPDVLDKEAGTLSLEAYLALYEHTHEDIWLTRARAAADYAETYVYLWNVPMPVDSDNAHLHWKKGVSTVGTQLITTGSAAVDEYMAFDTDEFVKLGRWTGDDHYLTMAKILLHNTKNMVSDAQHPYDLKGFGWQQEHFNFAQPRGQGAHRLWLPWVSTSQLNGMLELEEFDPALYRQWLAKP